MIQNPRLWLTISLAIIAISLGLIFFIRPVLGVDFTGGSLTEVVLNENASQESIRELLQSEFDLNVTIQQTDNAAVLIRSRALGEDEHRDIILKLQERVLISEELRFESIGPTIGAELRQKSWLALAMVVGVMIGYLAYTFRQVAGLLAPWKFGVAAAYALIHDLLAVTAIFVILGKTLDVPIDTLFVTALLAILGYSVNDTIVLFNRFKEEWLITRSENMLAIIDKATKATLIRSLNTSLTTLIVLGSILLFGGATIRWFVVALSFGTIFGTYSSLFVAPPLLYYLARK